jgi:hypothetical protein
MLKTNHPDFIKRSQKEVDSFLKAVAPFENDDKYDGNQIQSCYVNMIYSFIDKHLADNKDVYMTFIENQEVQQMLSKYPKESVFAAYKISKSNSITKVDYKDFDFDIFIKDKNPDDRMVKRFKDYYGSLFADRATIYENLKDNNEAIKYYNLALSFLKRNNNFREAISQRIEILKQKKRSLQPN